MGADGEHGAPGNEWRTSNDWPVPAKDTSYYLQAANSGPGALSLQPLESGSRSTEFVADPLHPAPIPGRAFAGAKDAREYEKHPDVRLSPLIRFASRSSGRVLFARSFGFLLPRPIPTLSCGFPMCILTGDRSC